MSGYWLLALFDGEARPREWDRNADLDGPVDEMSPGAIASAGVREWWAVEAESVDAAREVIASGYARDGQAVYRRDDGSLMLATFDGAPGLVCRILASGSVRC